MLGWSRALAARGAEVVALARRPADRRLWGEFLGAHDPVVFGGRDCPREAYDELRRRALAPLPGEPQPEEPRAGAPR